MPRKANSSRADVMAPALNFDPSTIESQADGIAAISTFSGLQAATKATKTRLAEEFATVQEEDKLVDWCVAATFASATGAPIPEKPTVVLPYVKTDPAKPDAEVAPKK